MSPQPASHSPRLKPFATLATLALLLTALVCALAILPALAHAAPAPPVVGNWQGTLSAGGQSFRLILHVTQAKDETLSATMDSLDQGANALPLEKVEYKEPKFHFELGGPAPAVFDGAYDKSKSEISGHWMQSGMDFPLVFGPIAVSGGDANSPRIQ